MKNQMKLQKNFSNHFLSIYQIRLETSMIGSDFVFDCIHLLYYKLHKINYKCDGLSVDSPD